MGKWFCAEETSYKVYRYKICSTLYKTSSRFLWYGNIPSINELIIFGSEIYPITPSPKN